MAQESRFCHRCGSPLPPGSAFCPKCGASVSPPPQTVPSSPPSPTPSSGAGAPTHAGWNGRYEKREKQEKREKGEKNEKGRGGDLAGALAGGLILILLGVLFYLSELGNYAINWNNFWEYLLIGIGAILILQGIIRYAQMGHMYPGSFIGGAVLILIGFAFIANTSYAFWPLILVILGVAAIASAFVGRNRVPRP